MLPVGRNQFLQPATIRFMPFEPTKDFLEQISMAVETKGDAFILKSFSGMHPTDISEILDRLETAECKYIFGLLDSQICTDILSNLESDTRAKFLSIFSPIEIAFFLDYADSDDGADVLNEQPIKIREEVIAHMRNKQTAQDVTELLRYEEDCAGGLMAKELIRVNISWTVKQCIDEIRRQAEHVEKILTVYVVNEKQILQGRLSIKQLLLSSDEKLVADMLIKALETVQTYYSEEEVAEIMQKYDLESVPVVNVQGKLMGRITIDDVLDVITEQAEIDQQIMSGISENIEEDDSVLTLSRARLPWLLIGTIGGLLGAQFIGFFETDLKLVPAMAFFIPLITATGGNVGIQSSTIVVQALANASSFVGGTFQRLSKAFTVALVNGVVIALVVFGFNVIFTEVRLALIVSIALFSVVCLASLMGTITPIVLDRLGINPALASGPFITTANDLIGLAVYFLVARMLI
ncbi:MAG: magnesium transporter [Bacteroidia bacterium]|jgi:magnesium transporter